MLKYKNNINPSNLVDLRHIEVLELIKLHKLNNFAYYQRSGDKDIR